MLLQNSNFAHGTVIQKDSGGRLCRKHKIGPLLFYYHPFFRTQFSH